MKKTVFDKKRDVLERIDLLEDILLKVGNEVDVEIHRLMANDEELKRKLDGAWKELMELDRRMQNNSAAIDELHEATGEIEEANNVCFDDIDKITDRLDFNPIFRLGAWLSNLLSRLRL
jgi:septal ring factor EnvC (AmiA/AmiB activator)